MPHHTGLDQPAAWPPVFSEGPANPRRQDGAARDSTAADSLTGRPQPPEKGVPLSGLGTRVPRGVGAEMWHGGAHSTQHPVRKYPGFGGGGAPGEASTSKGTPRCFQKLRRWG